uniref:Alpha-type protein kinase domain-containing protein n=1 Tax=Zooxanthella nutricula TaxID=1333877 RepID=A0A7S2VME6_9DINO
MPSSRAMVPSFLARCMEALNVDAAELCCGDSADVGDLKPAAAPTSGPALALRVAYAPGAASAGARIGPFGQGDDIAVTKLEKLRGHETLGWRHERATSSKGSLFPSTGPRYAVKHDYWRAKVVASDGQGGFEECWCLLSAAERKQERTIEVSQAAVDDAMAAATYAHAFNAQTARLHNAEEGGEHDAESVVGVRVCVPVGCYVLGGASMDVAQPGQVVTVAMYPYSQVDKFVFDGQGEDFVELAQAFFHYCSWFSGGQTIVGDLQGLEDEVGDLILVDPVVIKPPPVTVTDVLGTLVGGAPGQSPQSQAHEESKERQRFDAWHPRCSQLCKAFDPARRSAHCRRTCGLAAPSCGVGGA